MLDAISNYINRVIHGEKIRLGGKVAQWKKVSELTSGMKIAVATKTSKSEAIFFDEIVSIKKVGREKVWDIEIKGTHNFVGNDILAHNTYIESGNVGIGTTSPLEKLSVSGNATVSGNLTLAGGARTIAGREMNALTIGDSSTGDIQFFSSSNYITSAGNLVLGGTISAAGTKFQVDSNGDITKLKNLTYSWPSSHTTDGFLKDDGSGTLSWTTIAGAGGVTGTGTSGQATFWTGTSSVLGDNSFWWDNTEKRLGIGTTSPGYKLDVVGTASISGQLTMASHIVPYATSQFDLGSSSLHWANLYVDNVYGGTSGTSGYWQRTSGSLAPTNITDSLNLGATATTSALIHFTGTSGGNSWINTGNVGIGTTGPDAKLVVDNGASEVRLGIDGSSTYKWYFTAQSDNWLRLFNAATGGSYADLAVGNSYVVSNAYFANSNGVWNSSGNVGIGTTSPLEKLDVSGNATISGNLVLASAASTTRSITGTAGNPLSINTLVIDSSGVITTGTWKGTAIAATYGGTGQTTYATGDILYASATNTLAKLTAGADGKVLKLSGGVPVWGDDQTGGGGSEWTLSNGSLYPNNSTLDLLIGGTATTSAKFGFLNINSGTPVASFSGVLTLNNSGTNYLNSLGGQALSLRTSVGGDTGLTDRLYITNNGNVGIGTTNPKRFTIYGTAGNTFQGWNNPSTAANDSSVGEVDWSNPTNCFTSNNSWATAFVYLTGTITHYLKATNFGFSVPSTATIEGVSVIVEVNSGDYAYGRDNSIKLVVGGSITGDNKADSSPWPASDAEKTYGGLNDTWGLSLTPANINASDFGVAVSGKHGGGTQNSTLAIDHITIKVSYAYEGQLFVVSSDSGTQGYVGIGTSDPSTKLEVFNGALCVDDDTSSCPSTGTPGTIYAESTSITEIDLAENYPTLDTSLEAGELVSVNPEKKEYVSKSFQAYDSKLLGIISTKPGILLGGQCNDPAGCKESQVPVALAGRIPIKVSDINGPIKTGDPITSSEIPGVGMKATQAGPIVGKALEEFDPDNGLGSVESCPATDNQQQINATCGQILAFVNLSWTDPTAYLTDTGRLTTADNASTLRSLVFGGASPSTINILNGNRLDIQTSAEGETGLTPRLTILNNGNVGIGTTNPATPLAISGLGETTGTALVVDGSGNVYKAGSSRRYKDNIQNYSTDFRKIMEAQLVSFDYKTTGSHDIGFLAEDLDALQLNDLVIYDSQGRPDAIKYDKISLYLLEILKEQEQRISSLSAQIQIPIVNVGMNPEEAEGLSANLNAGSVLDLKVLQTLVAQGVLIVEGPAEFKGEVTFANKVFFDKDTAGTAVIPEMSQVVEVDFEKEYLLPPIVTISLIVKDENDKLFMDEVKAAVGEVTTKGFKIVLSQVVPRDVEFSWVAIAVKDPRKVVGQSLLEGLPEVTPTEALTPAPTATPTATPTIILTPTPTIETVPTASPTLIPTSSSTPTPSEISPTVTPAGP